MATKATAPALKISVKPFAGELPERKGPSKRHPTPFDDLFGTLVAEAKKGRTVEGKKEQTSSVMLAGCKYNDPTELKPIASQLRSALKLHDPDGEHGLRTSIVPDGLAFQVGPKVVREKKEKPKEKPAEEAPAAATA